MTMSNSISRSNTLKFDDVIGVILSERTHRKSSSWYALGSVSNAQRRGRMNERGKNS